MIFPSKLKEIDFTQKILSFIYFYQGGFQYKDLLDMNYNDIFELLEETEKLDKRIERNLNNAKRGR